MHRSISHPRQYNRGKYVEFAIIKQCLYSMYDNELSNIDKLC